MNSEFQVPAECLMELLKVILVLSNLTKDIHTLLNDVLVNNLKNLVLLKGLMENIKGEIFRVDDTLNEVEIFKNDVFIVIHDEDIDVKLNIAVPLLGLEDIEKSIVSELLFTVERKEKERKTTNCLVMKVMALNFS